MSYTYLAGPYSNNREKNFKIHEEVLHRLFTGNEVIFSPIVHSHNLALEFNLPTDFDFWKRQNAAMLGPASKLIVIKAEGWEESLGTQAEIALAKTLGIEIEYYEWKEEALSLSSST